MRLLAKILAPALVLCALALAGCGGDDSGDSGSPLESALSFLPADTPFAVAIDTDVEGDQFKALERLADRFPFGDQLQRQLEEQIQQGTGDVSYEDDVKPLLGNPFVVGAVDVKSFISEGQTDDFVAAIQAKDGDKLRDVLEESGAKESGEQAGATLYEQGGDRYAVKGDTLVVAGNDRLLEQALARADGGDHLTPDTFDAALADLPESALVRLYTDVRALLQGDPSTADARKVKWVDALRTLGLTASVDGDQIDVDFDLETAGGLSDEDLPLAAGDASPEVIDERGEINVGLRGLGQIVRFAERAGQAIDPSGFGQYAQAKEQLDRRLGVDIDDDLVAQLSGDVSINVAVDGGFGVRAELEDPAAFERTLAKIAPVLPDVAEGAGFGPVGLAKPRKGQDFYALAQPDGDSVVFGVVGRVFVLANDPARAGRLATQEPKPVEGAKGALLLKADAAELAGQVITQLGEQLGTGGSIGGRLFTRRLADLIGSIRSSTEGLEGSFSLGVD